MDDEEQLLFLPPLSENEEVEDTDHDNDKAQSLESRKSVSEKKDEPESDLPLAEQTDENYSQEIKQMQEIRRSFSTVINEFEKDSSVEKFVEEYKKLYEVLKESHRTQKKLMMECSNLRCDIKNNAEKVNLAIHLSQEDKEIIVHLTKQVNQAWNEVDILAEKESKARSVINKLKGEIYSLTSLVEAGSGVQELHSVAQQAVSERKGLEHALLSLKEELEYRDMRISELTEKSQAKEEGLVKNVNKLKEKIQINGKRNQEMQQRIDDLENDVKMLERVRTNMISENTSITAELDVWKTKLNKLEKDEVDLRADLVKVTSVNSDLQETLAEKIRDIGKLTADVEVWRRRYENSQNSNNTLKETLEQRDVTLQDNSRILRKKETEIESLIKKGEQTTVAIKLLQKQLQDRETGIKQDKDNISHMQASLLATQKNLENVEAQRGRLQRANELELSTNLKLSTKKETVEKALFLKNKINQCLSIELNAMGKQVKKGLEAISTLQADKERLYGRINQILDMVNNLAGDNDNKEAKLITLLKLNNEQLMNIHNCNSKLVRMTNKRDNISNELHLVQLKNEELNLVNLNFGKQSASLSEDLRSKELDITRLQNKILHLEEHANTRLNEIQALKDERALNQQKITDLGQKVFQMERVLCDRERKIGDISLIVDQIVHQRNVLGYQYCKKMEQVHLLTEKNNLMQSLFKAGNRSYNFQMKVIDQLKLGIMNLYRQKTILMNKLDNIENLRSKLGLANQQLVSALSRVRAMEGEHPYNLHRWRHLKAMDISQYEMIVKIQHLQKRVIMKTDEVTALERALLDKTTIVTEMKLALERRPGPEIVASARLDRDAKEKLEKKLKAAIAEKNVCIYKADRQTTHNRSMLTRLLDEKKKSLALNKANMELKKKISRLPAIQQPFKNIMK